ncbi:hypothetical protein B4N89_31140 [Embleya scabrispora]|uniref:Uncharacterized protein n=1 Tax=Embleya scabrispora TaxID=159449 RepID=A0A1T3NNV8_9ACTN|nr:hypothetical protein [Embleya scabrispora]OPC78633.1 hypothetical protein B4N89_31140 [Embleya scabrispora]
MIVSAPAGAGVDVREDPLAARAASAAALLDATAPRPRVIRREDAALGLIAAVARTATSCAAPVAGPNDADGPTCFAKWRWDMPGWTLRERPQCRRIPRRRG